MPPIRNAPDLAGQRVKPDPTEAGRSERCVGPASQTPVLKSPRLRCIVFPCRILNRLTMDDGGAECGMDFLKKRWEARDRMPAHGRGYTTFARSLAADLLQEQRRAIGCSVFRCGVQAAPVRIWATFRVGG